MPASDGSWRSCPLRGRYADFVSYEMALRPLGKNGSVLGPSGAKLAEYARKHRGLTRPLIRTFSATLSLVGQVNGNIQTARIRLTAQRSSETAIPTLMILV